MYSAVETPTQIKLYMTHKDAYLDNTASTGVYWSTLDEAMQTGKEVIIGWD